MWMLTPSYLTEKEPALQMRRPLSKQKKYFCYNAPFKYKVPLSYKAHSGERIRPFSSCNER